jgi:Uracil DNA glycosylase superfamily
MDGLVERASESVMPYAAPAVPKGTLARRPGGRKGGCAELSTRSVAFDTGASDARRRAPIERGAVVAHDFDPGFPRRFRTLVRNYPEGDVYPVEDFRLEWGPVFHRGRLDGTARVIVLGQDPAAHETIARRILVGEAGQRIQGFLARLGITTSYVMINTFLYSVYGQSRGEKHKDDPNIARYRNQWLDKLIVGQSVDAVVTLGWLADRAFQAWRATPSGQAGVFQQAVTHPTFPESSSASGQTTKAEAMAKMLENWNVGLQALAPHITQPDAPRPLELYGTKLEDADLAPIPEADLPAGLPPWMRSLKAWASRAATGSAALPTASEEQQDEAKRATIVVAVPTKERPWHPTD